MSEAMNAGIAVVGGSISGINCNVKPEVSRVSVLIQ